MVIQFCAVVCLAFSVGSQRDRTLGNGKSTLTGNTHSVVIVGCNIIGTFKDLDI